jgi:thioredoxin reductase (NADPH)
MSSRIENYLGFPVGLSGSELTHRAVTQARRFGVEILSAQKVTDLVSNGPTKTVKLQDGSELLCRSVLIATGVSYRKLEAEGMEELTGSGVYYGASMSEGESVRGQDVVILGGANSAGQAAMYFSRFAKSVTIIIRGESISTSMSQYLIDRIDATDNITIRSKTEIAEVKGNTRLECLKLINQESQKDEILAASALYIFIGAIPHIDWLCDEVVRDSHGFILSGSDIGKNGRIKEGLTGERNPFMLETSVPGVFVAGDVRHGSVKRVASAVGEGSMAVMFVHRYLSTV